MAGERDLALCVIKEHCSIILTSTCLSNITLSYRGMVVNLPEPIRLRDGVHFDRDLRWYIVTHNWLSSIHTPYGHKN